MDNFLLEAISFFKKEKIRENAINNSLDNDISMTLCETCNISKEVSHESLQLIEYIFNKINNEELEYYGDYKFKSLELSSKIFKKEIDINIICIFFDDRKEENNFSKKYSSYFNSDSNVLQLYLPFVSGNPNKQKIYEIIYHELTHIYQISLMGHGFHKNSKKEYKGNIANISSTSPLVRDISFAFYFSTHTELTAFANGLYGLLNSIEDSEILNWYSYFKNSVYYKNLQTSKRVLTKLYIAKDRNDFKEYLKNNFPNKKYTPSFVIKKLEKAIEKYIWLTGRILSEFGRDKNLSQEIINSFGNIVF